MNDPIVDVNVNLSHWPTRRMREDETPMLVAKLKAHGVVEAWAGSFDGLLHKDIAAVNARLVKECSDHQGIRLVWFPSDRSIQSCLVGRKTLRVVRKFIECPVSV